MRSDDYRADNLLLRLFSYTPRAERTPLEDFCTESLAWCVRNCASFRREFFKSLNLKVKAAGRFAISTQHSYDYEDEAEDGDCDAGRLDLLIQLDDDEVLAVIEVKAWSSFNAEQLGRYRKQVDRCHGDLKFKRRPILITLTGRSEKPEGTDRHLMWSTVYKFLARQTLKKELLSDYGRTVCKEFAEFLKEKGLGPMNVPKIATKHLDSWLMGMRFRASLENVLNGVKNSDEELVRVLRHKRVKYEENEGVIWIGIYGNQQKFFWVGFGLEQEPGVKRTRVFMLVQTALPGDRRKDFPRATYAKGKTWIEKQQTVDSRFDGNGERIRDWLISESKELLKIK
jgi:hypothetical protein